MKKWGLFATENEVEKTEALVEDNGLEVFEVRQLTWLEKLTYGFSIAGDIWIVMFNASQEEYEALIAQNKLTKVF